MLVRFTHFVIAVALSIQIAASSDSARPNDYLITFDHIPSPHFGRVNAIIRDDRGFLWFGTSKGLCKYNGYEVRVFTIGTSPDIEQQIVTSMIRLDSSSLLLGTGMGLWTFDLTTESTTRFPSTPEIPDTRINTIVEDADSTIWIGTNSHGLFRCDRRATVLRYTTDNGLSSNNILSLVVGRSGGLWIGTLGGGLNMLDKAKLLITHYRSNTTNLGTLYSDNITSLCENDNQEMWIGTGEGLNVLNLKTGKMARMDLHSYTRHSIMSLARDPAGRMWVAALDLGLLYYSNGRFTHFTTLNDVGRSLGSVRVLYPDPIATTSKSLLLWVGARSGVNKVLMSQNPFANHIRDQDSLQLERGGVLSVCEDCKGILWVGLWGGGLDAIAHTQGRYQRITNFNTSPSSPLVLPNNDVGTVIEDKNGNLWLGTAGGLAMLDQNRKKMVVYKHLQGDSTSLASNHVDGVYEDRSGAIWVSTLDGLSEFIHGQPSRFNNHFLAPKQSDPIEGNHVSGVFEDNLSNHWVATYGRGLNKLETDGTYKRFLDAGDSAGTKENWIYGIAEDNEGLFWLSTRAGLVSFDPQSGKYTRHTIGVLSDEHIFGIFIDQQNDLWLSTEVGLATFSPKTQSLTRFDEKDGLAFTELLSGFFRNSHGKLFVGGRGVAASVL